MKKNENKEMPGIPGLDFGRMMDEMLGGKRVSRRELFFLNFKKWFGILVNILVKMMIAITIIPLSSGISKKIFIIVFILWMGRPLIDRLLDIAGKFDLIKKMRSLKNGRE